MPHISTLVNDIYRTLSRKDDWFTQEMADELGKQTSARIFGQYQSRKEAPTLRISRLGSNCPKALWHSIHTPDEAEALPPHAKFKFSYGHLLEALTICLAKAAGHDVVGEQDELVLDGIKGHRDCVIDGCVVDVKSASTQSFEKFKTGSIKYYDSFGYLEQLDGYVCASANDPLVSTKDRGYLLAIDKQLGHMCLYEHQVRPDHIRNRINDYKAIVAQATPPECRCTTIEDGAGGNIKLDVRASYNPYKFCCFPHLRTFLYAGGRRYLTKVVKRPVNSNGPITEVDRYGKIVYN